MAQNKMRKEYQRQFTKKLRETNRAIREDNLWLGRVEVRQISARWEEFSDGSGGILHTVLRCIDKKTRQYKDYCLEYIVVLVYHTLHTYIICIKLDLVVIHRIVRYGLM